MNNSIAHSAVPSTTTLHEEVRRLLRLKSSNVKKELENAGEEVAITYLSELFKGNGWTVAFHTGARNHKSLLLSDPHQPDTIILIIKFILKSKALTYDEARHELIDFENNIGPVYNCSQFCLLSVHGFEEKAERLEKYNLLLQDWSSMEELINHYSKDKVQEPRIQLFAHNKQTYKKVRKMMTHAKGVAVVQATGTGKSYLIARLLQDFAGEKRLVMAPSYYIIDQIKEHIRWETDLPGDANKIEFMTYARSMNLTVAEINDLKPKMIVLDEFHRCGAEEWGRGVQDILGAYPQTFKFGTSATPIRYLDNGRDMSMELFQGHVAENLSLAQAIVRNILPMPKYVCALYTLSEEISSMRERIAGSRRNEETKRKLLLDLDTIHIDWERSRGIPHVLKKHLRKNMRKFIIFCKDEAHLNEMEPMVKKWFKEAMDDIAVKSYIVHSKEAQSDEQLEAFKNETSKDHLHLLFSIDMLNEGLHVNEVNGVMLLRPTESPNIFYQQIGRCLKVGGNERPVIFDFVNNFKAIRTHDFMYDLDFARKELLDRRSEESLEDRCPRFNVNDEVREITEMFGQIEFKLDNWEEMFERLEAYKKRFGHCVVPREWEEDKPLYFWLRQQRKRYFYNHLNEDQKERLDKLGVKWDYQPDEDVWAQNFQLLAAYKEKHGHCQIEREENKPLYEWTLQARRDFLRGRLDMEKTGKLKKLGFNFSPIEEIEWKKNLKELKEHKAKYEDYSLLKSRNRQLFNWINGQLKKHRRGNLSADKFNILKSMGLFDYLFKDEVWEKKYNQLAEFKNEHGHFKIPRIGANRELCLLRSWFDRQRQEHKEGTLTEEKWNKLKALGVNFIQLDELWDKNYRMLVEYKNKNGHINLTKQSKDTFLATWLQYQRGRYNKGQLSAERINKLKAIGVVFNPIEEDWENNFRRLVEYKKEHGDFMIPYRVKEYDSLYGWVNTQRGRFRESKLDHERINRLKAIGFSFNNKLEEDWERNYLLLVEFKKEHGDLNIPHRKKEYALLAGWAHNQRSIHRKGKLEKSRVNKLKKIGFVFELLDEAWNKWFKSLEEFKSKFGHCNVPHNNSEFRLLNRWAQHQRGNYREGILEKDKIKRMEAIGFDFAPKDIDGDWQERLNELVAYKKKNGHLEVTPGENKTLNIWVSRQRARRKKGLLPGDRINKLDAIGFVWKMGNSKIFEKKFIALQEYKKEHGHLKIPISNPLYAWQTHLRNQHKAGKLTEQQMQRLKEMGFNYVFKVNHTLVRKKRLQELESFYKKHGHINVTAEHKDFASLAGWLNETRKPGRRATYPKEFIDHLNAMGMIWERK